MQHFDAIVFDLDGVIIDSEPLHERAIMHVCADFDVPMGVDMLEPFKGKTDRDVFEYILDVYAPANATVPLLLESKRSHYAALLPQLQPIQGAIDSIADLHAKRYRMALTTSATPVNQALAFGRFGLAPYFEVVTTAADVTRAKPHPEPYLTTAAKLHLSPAGVLVIEDSIHGVHAGKAAGCRVAAITSSFEAPALVNAGADFVFDHYPALLDWISNPGYGATAQ